MARSSGDVRAREVVSGIYGPLLYVAKSTRRRSQTKIARDAIEVDMHAQNKRAEEIPSLCTSGLWELGASRELHWQTGRAQALEHDTLDRLHRLPLRSVESGWRRVRGSVRGGRASVNSGWMGVRVRRGGRRVDGGGIGIRREGGAVAVTGGSAHERLAPRSSVGGGTSSNSGPGSCVLTLDC